MSNEVATSSDLPSELQADWMTEDEVAKLLKKHRCTISRMISEGVLSKHSERYGRKVLISRSSVQKYLDRFKPQFVKPTGKRRKS